MKSTELKRRTPLRRKGRIRPKPSSERAKDFARKYGSQERVIWIKLQGCLVCDKRAAENAHIGNEGLGRKSDHTRIVPLCRDHHDELDGRKKGATGVRAFNDKYRVDLDLDAVRIACAWEER